MSGDTCDGECSPKGRCDPSHPLHCCHLVATEYVTVGKMLRYFHVCVKCDRVSRVKTTVIPGLEPGIRRQGPAI
jgi:hypothetical protein